jgi:splicing suppressor protein 51
MIHLATSGENDEWSDLNFAVEKEDIIEHYKDPMMPLLLRFIAEKVYGRNAMAGY